MIHLIVGKVSVDELVRIGEEEMLVQLLGVSVLSDLESKHDLYPHLSRMQAFKCRIP